MGRNYFHLHLVSDATGETLIAVSRAATTQYQGVASIEHVYPLVRTHEQLDRVISEIESAPGLVLFTLVDLGLSERLETFCKENGCPCLSVLTPVHAMIQSYLGAVSTPRPGAQHMLNADYFRRIDALNFTMMHDDGQMAEDLEEADVVLVGISRTSKTPTSIYLANRGVKTANIPLVPGVPHPPQLEKLIRPLVVGLVASPDRIVQIRQNRLLSLNASDNTDYADKTSISEELANARRLFSKHDWPVIDVTRRSIEEASATIIEWYNARKATLVAQ
jgi:[pyruvate, water dikinase]-phosphate phosphotransferase / [pyruvate, water dikinase] kinase